MRTAGSGRTRYPPVFARAQPPSGIKPRGYTPHRSRGVARRKGRWRPFPRSELSRPGNCRRRPSDASDIAARRGCTTRRTGRPPRRPRPSAPSLARAPQPAPPQGARTGTSSPVAPATPLGPMIHRRAKVEGAFRRGNRAHARHDAAAARCRVPSSLKAPGMAAEGCAPAACR